jgi:hypothetical protein
VSEKIIVVTAGKKHEKLLVERLQDCKTVEEVEKRIVEEEAYIAKLIPEQKTTETEKGKGQVINEDKQGEGELTEQQKKARSLAGLPDLNEQKK